MNCKHLLENLDDYADGKLSGWPRWRVRLHLWICRNCRRYLQTYKATIRLARRAFGDSSSADAPEDLVQSILSARRQP
jgi:anti-sigma factor RsiW